MPKGPIQALYYDVWPTAWGAMGALAGKAGVCNVILPHYPMNDLIALIEWEHKGIIRDAPALAALAGRAQAYFNGQRVDFAPIGCDLPGEASFTGKVLRACRAIPYGRTASYSDLAKEIGQPEAARAVAAALSKNEVPLVIPCHRVTYADGRCGGFSAPGGEALKRRMLALEKEIC